KIFQSLELGGVVGRGCPESRQSWTLRSISSAMRRAPSGAPFLCVQNAKGARKEQSMRWVLFKRNFALQFVLGLAILGLVASGTSAQTGTTSLRGIVTDQSGAAITGARVILNNAQQGLHREDVTGSGGEYEFLALPPGVYVLDVEA